MKKAWKILLTAVIVISLVAIAALSVNALSQDKKGWYEIATPQDLVDFAAVVENNRKANAKLTADLDMSGVSYTPPSASYYGIFDGQGHTIKNLHRTVENATGTNYGLLFNTVGNGYNDYLFGEIMNLTMQDCSITVTRTNGEIFVGAVAGKFDRHDAYDITLKNVDVTFNGTGNSSGALVAGIAMWPSVRDDGADDLRFFGITADADCSVTSTNNIAGGVIGKYNDSGSPYLHDINIAAAITSTNNVAGGVMGRYNVSTSGKFVNITVSGTISGTNSGVIAGDIYTGRKPEIVAITNLTNNTTLQVPFGWYQTETTILYCDDVATYGTAPKTDDGAFLISTADELRWFAKYVNSTHQATRIRLVDTAILTADIDMSGKEWKPMEKFRGLFDGNGHTISGLNVTVVNAANDTKHGLLMGMLGNSYNAKVFGVVKDLTITDSTLAVSGNNVKYNVGGIAGESNRGSFYNCTLKNVDINVTGNLNENTVVGGIAGWVAYAPENPGRDYIQSYHNCHVDKDCSITSDSPNAEVGGIFGILGSECVRVLNCTVSATLSGAKNVGGIAGNISSGGNRWYMISDCGFFGKITAGASSGGIIGYAKKNGFILDTSVTGSIVGNVTGELVGTLASGYSVHTKRNTNGTMTLDDGKTAAIYAQTRPSAAGHDLRILILADLDMLATTATVNVEISFYDKDGNTVKKTGGILGGENSDYALYYNILANDETFSAGENEAFFGTVIVNIPNGAYSYFEVTVSDDQNTPITEGSSKPTPESSLEGKTFYFLGSSVTYGSASNGKSMADFIAERNNCTVVKEAVSGTTLVTSNENSYVYRLLNGTNFDKNAKVDHLIVQLSTNDASQNKPLGTVSESYDLNDFDTTTIIGAMEYIICYAKNTWGCEVSFYTGTNYNSNLYAQMVVALYDLEEKWGIGVIDMFFDVDMGSIPTAEYNQYMSDTIHPNILGYEEWWTPVFEKHLKSYQYQ